VHEHQVFGAITVYRAPESIGYLGARDRHVQDMAGPLPPSKQLVFWRFVVRAEVLINNPRGRGSDTGQIGCHGFLF
jgi:hypothetical protein